MRARNLNENPEPIKFSSLAIVSRLGRGSTSHVFKTQSIRTKQMFAMKVIDKSDQKYDKSGLEREISIHSRLKCMHIVQLMEHFEDSENHYLLTEYCPDGESTKFLLQPNISQETISNIAHQVALALDYMHNEAKIAHGDIKLSNILLSGSKIKLCDFGFSISLINQNIKTTEHDKYTQFGTLMYAAPETLSREFNICHKESDIWSLGICLLTLMLKEKPYRATNDKQLTELIQRGQYINPTENCSQFFSAELIDLVERMLNSDPSKRIAAANILTHPVFTRKNAPRIISAKNQIYSKTQKKGKKKISLSKNKFSPGHKTPIKAQKKQLSNKAEKQNSKSPKQDKNILNFELCHQQNPLSSEHLYQLKDENSFNKTTDTSVIAEETQLENTQQTQTSKDRIKFQPFYFWCLKPQIQKTKQNGYIEIRKDHSIRIKVKNIVYTINQNFQELSLEKKAGSLKKYNLSELDQKLDLKEIQKIVCLMEYAREVVSLLKRKQCQFQLVEDGKYYWVQRISSNRQILQGQKPEKTTFLCIKGIFKPINLENFLSLSIENSSQKYEELPKIVRAYFQ